MTNPLSLPDVDKATKRVDLRKTILRPWHVSQLCDNDIRDADGNKIATTLICPEHSFLIVNAINLFEAHEAVAEAARAFGVALDSPMAVKLHKALANLDLAKGKR